MRKKFYLLVIMFLIMIIPTNVKAINNDYRYSYYDYIINSYDVDIKVNEDNTFNITETIDVNFNEYKHGIFRKIPLKNTISRLDGTTSKNRGQIYDVEVNNEFTTSKENGNFIIKIGSPNYTVTGDKSYTIKYTYNIGKDPLKEKDEVYYNIIGNEWDTIIKKVTFTINMPKDFDESKLGFSSGLKGSTDNTNVSYNVIGNTITGSYNNILGVGEGLTVRMELPEDYFINEGYRVDKTMFLYFLVPSICLLISVLLWYLYGKDDNVIETVEFYPPEGYNSLEIGFLYKGKADNKDVTSLLIHLANKGYLRIHNGDYDFSSKKLNLDDETLEEAKLKIAEFETKIEQEKLQNPSSPKIRIYENLLEVYKDIDKPINYELTKTEKIKINLFDGKSEFTIEKVKDYEDNNVLERIFFNGLFKKHDIVTKHDLYDEFYKTMNVILSNINSKKNKKQIFTSTFSFKFAAVILMIIISILTIIGIPTMEYSGGEEIFITIFLTLFYIPFYAVGLSKNIPIGFRIIWLGFTIFHSSAFFSTLPIRIALTSDILYLTGFVLGVGCIIGMFICFNHLPKRNKYGNEILGKIRGFKNFLETAEKEKLEMMVYENPSYFYDILPYTYVLGISDKWIKKFESIALKAPDWSDDDINFNVNNFGDFMDKTMSSAQRVMSTSKSSSSGSSIGGSSSSGGGSSGGGSGGGGGGSW